MRCHSGNIAKPSGFPQVDAKEHAQGQLENREESRMALTDYLMQSVLCPLFFYHYTTGLYGRIGPALGLLAMVILYGQRLCSAIGGCSDIALAPWSGCGAA